MENSFGEQDDRGKNPFDYFTLEGEKISKYIKCFDSSCSTSKYVYNDIKDNIEDLIEYGIEHKPSTWWSFFIKDNLKVPIIYFSEYFELN